MELPKLGFRKDLHEKPLLQTATIRVDNKTSQEYTITNLRSGLKFNETTIKLQHAGDSDLIEQQINIHQ